MHPDLLFWIIPATLAGAILSALVASVLLLFPDERRSRLLPGLVSFAVGALLGAAITLAVESHAPRDAQANAPPPAASKEAPPSQ